jgi:hypothetical protein
MMKLLRWAFASLLVVTGFKILSSTQTHDHAVVQRHLHLLAGATTTG